MPETLSPVLAALALVALGALAGSASGAIWGARRGSEVASSLRGLVSQALAQISEFREEQSRARAAQAAWMEEATGVLEAVERKRRRAAASASAANRDQVEEETTLTPEQRREREIFEARQRVRNRGA